VTNDTRARRRPALSSEDKLHRRDEIMAAAKKVFACNGFHAATIADVAGEARLAYGSVYQYFDSKEDLFQALMSAEGYALRTHIAVALAETGTRAETSWAPLRAAAQATFEFFEEDKATAKLLLRDAYALGARFENHLNDIYERYIDDIAAYMAAAQQHGKVISAPPRMVAFTVAALIGHLAHRRLITDDGVTAAEVADFVIEFIGNGLRPHQSRPQP